MLSVLLVGDVEVCQPQVAAPALVHRRVDHRAVEGSIEPSAHARFGEHRPAARVRRRERPRQPVPAHMEVGRLHVHFAYLCRSCLIDRVLSLLIVADGVVEVQRLVDKPKRHRRRILEVGVRPARVRWRCFGVYHVVDNFLGRHKLRERASQALRR